MVVSLMFVLGLLEEIWRCLDERVSGQPSNSRMGKFSADLAAAKWMVRKNVSVASCVSFRVVMSLVVDELLVVLLFTFTW